MDRKRARIGSAVHPAPVQKSRLRWLWPAAAGVLFVVALGLASYVLFRSKPAAPAETLRFQIPASEKSAFNIYLALSPDGRKLAYVADGADGQSRLWIRSMDSLESRPLAGTEGAVSPFWSPDSRFIAFGVGNKLKRMDVSGGPVQTVCELQVAARRGLLGTGRDDDRRQPRQWTGNVARLRGWRHGVSDHQSGHLPPGTSAWIPHSASGWQAFPLHPALERRGERGHFSGNAWTPSPTPRVPSEFCRCNRVRPMYLRRARDPGICCSCKTASSWLSPSMRQQFELSGEPVALAEQIGTLGSYGFFSASASGTLAYRLSGVDANNRQLTWYDRQGKALGIGGTARRSCRAQPVISPDGGAVAIARLDRQTGFTDIWVHDVSRNTDSRLTSGPASSTNPVWSPDGSKIAFSNNRGGSLNLYQKNASGVGQEEALDEDQRSKVVRDWSHDGQYLIEEVGRSAKTGLAVWVLPLFGDRKPFPYLESEFDQDLPQGFAQRPVAGLPVE